jgi:hypothetical protein
MTVRTQYAVASALAAVTNATGVQFTVNRPRTLPVEGNTVDFVARGYTRQEFEGGLAVVHLNPALATGTDHAVRAVEILDWDGNVSRTVLSTTGNGYLGNGTDTAALLARLMIEEDDAGVRVTVIKLSGGSTANCGITCNFDFGLNNANYGSTA